jgi:hypothetical protein
MTVDAIKAEDVCVLLLSFEDAIMKVQQKQEGLKLHGAHQLLICAAYVTVLGDIRKNKEV